MAEIDQPAVPTMRADGTTDRTEASEIRVTSVCQLGSEALIIPNTPLKQMTFCRSAAFQLTTRWDIVQADLAAVSAKGMLQLDSLSALSTFVRAAEARSFTVAGRQLGLSSSAVGKAVSRLEERLGVRLFNRSTRTISLTQEGGIFLDTCRRIFSEIESVEREFAQSTGAARGRLRISMPLVGMLMMPTISRFLKAYPAVELDMEFTDHLVDVIDGGYDVVVRTGDATDSRLMSRQLGLYRLQIVASPAYLRRAGTPRLPHDLQSHSCLHHKYPTSGKLQSWPFKAGFEEHLALPSAATATTVEALVSMAENDVGLACVPDFAVRRQIRDGALAAVLEDCTESEGTFRALWPSSRHLAPKVRVFVDFLATHLFERSTD
jgi:DNA-binding transcriptional LysR family regulator